MRDVEVGAHISGTDPRVVFDTLADFGRYAELVDVVRSVKMNHAADGTATSSWEVEFRGGLLRWTENNWFDRDQLRLEFRQTEGDFADFSGSWMLEPNAEGVNVTLNIHFDFGIPSLTRLVEPVAERVLNDVTREILHGLFGDRVRFPERTGIRDRDGATSELQAGEQG